MNQKFLLSLCAISVVIYSTEALSQSCPLSSKMTNCSPKCKEDTECFGRKCCPNICNTKSCAEANQMSSSNGYKGSSGSGGTGAYCGNVKCNSFEKCIMDPNTKRQKCGRA